MTGISRRAVLKTGGALLAGSGALHRVAAVAQAPQFRDAERTKDRIVAVIRAFSREYVSPLPDVQQIKPVPQVAIPGVDVRADQLPLIDYFVGDLQIRYSFDDPRYISSVSAADLIRLGLTRERLLPLAVANFRRRYPNFRVERLPPGLSSVANAGELEPSLMLDARFWEQERERVRSEIVAAVPARDSLIFTSRAVTGTVELLRKVAVDVHDSAGGDALSKKLFLWTRGRWEVLA